MVPIVKAYSAELDPERAPRSPVAGERIFGGLSRATSCPRRSSPTTRDRYRALIVESGNPAHSVADSARMREALDALDFVLVIDVFMTETARHADYVLPATTQFEKFESTFFNFEFPKNVFHLRRPVVEATATARSTSPRSTPASSRRPGSSPTPTSNRCARPPSRVGPSSPLRSARRSRRSRRSGPSRPCCSTARSDRPCPMVRRRPPRLWAIAAAVRQLNPSGVEARRLRQRPGCR